MTSSIKPVKQVIVLAGDYAACGHFRILQPVKALQRINCEEQGVRFDLCHEMINNDTTSTVLIEFLSRYDAIWAQRVASPNILNAIKQAKIINPKIKVFIELDDALFHVHPSNPASTIWRSNMPAWDTLKEALLIADGLTLSTPELVEMYQHNNSVVFPNGIDLKLPIYSAENNRRSQLPSDKTTIGWAGSTSHISSLKNLVRPIKKLLRERDDILFCLCSNPEFMNFFDVDKKKKVYIKHKPIEDWPPVMSLFDISIATVQSDAFNACKSELKVLEAGVWGAPSVCTYVAPYTRFNKISNGGNSLVYENDVNEWVRSICKIIDDKKLYQEMQEKTLNTIKNHYDLEKINEKRIEFFKKELL